MLMQLIEMTSDLLLRLLAISRQRTTDGGDQILWQGHIVRMNVRI